MKIVFLAAAKQDLRWFKTYYIQAFPEGRANADRQYRAMLQLLKTSPMIGAPTDDIPAAREYPIRNTPFSVIYRVKPDVIEILRVFDQRSGFANARKRQDEPPPGPE